jgi:fluoride exporter
MLPYLFVALGSALGGVLRFLCTQLALRAEGLAPRSHLWSTVLINISGSFAIGYIGTATAQGSRLPLSSNARLFLMVGVCGGFTTFSSFSLQTFDLFRQGSPWRACSNILVSVLLCLGAVAAGHWVGQRIPPVQPPLRAIAQTAEEEQAS